MIHFIDDSEQAISYTDERIEQTIIKTGAKLCIFDPVQAFFGKANMNCAGSVRPMLKHLGVIAERHQCAIILVGHLDKSGGKAQYRGLGSVDIYSAVRSVLTFGKLEMDENMRAFVQIKNNLTHIGKPQAFGLDDLGAFCFLGECDASTEEFDGKKKKPDNQFTKARKLIETELAKGPVLSVDMYQMAEEEGISEKTLNRAKKELCVISVKRNNSWYWELPIEVEYSVVGQDGQHGQHSHQGQDDYYGQADIFQDGQDSGVTNMTTLSTLTMLTDGKGA
jgi:hypothetical protein